MGCPLEHTPDHDLLLKCGETYDIPGCNNTHTWICGVCKSTQEIITQGKTIPRTPTKQKSCPNNITYKAGDKIRYAECTHPATIDRTWNCGTKIQYNTTDCDKVAHEIKCATCFKCPNYINAEATSDFFPPCLTEHLYGPATYKCGQKMNFADCPKAEHFIKCLECGGNGKTLLPPSATSTPKAPTDEKDKKKEDNVDNNTTLKELADTNKQLRKALEDIDDENNCHSNHHEFESRTRKFLSAPARQFMNAYRACVFHFSRSQNPISKQFGDDILQKLTDAFNELQKVRQYCLEPFSDQEISEKYEYYMNEKLDLYNEALQLHDQHFNAEIIEEESLQRATKLSILQQNLQTTTQQIDIVPTIPQPRGFTERPIDQKPWSIRQPIIHRDPTFGLPNPFERNLPHTRQDTRQHHFKLKEELALVTKFNASQPREYMAFRANWTNFIQKMNIAKRSELDKYYALLSVLEGRAKDFIQTKYPRDGTYAEAIGKLDQLFYQPGNLLRDMMHTLNKTNKMVDTYDSLLQGITKLWDAWADLNHADLSKDQLKGLFFISASEKNLSREGWKFWLEIQNQPKNIANPLACYDINSYMGAIRKAMTNAEKMQNAIGKPQWAEQDRFTKPKSTLYGSYNMMHKNSNNKENKGNYKAQDQARTKEGKCVFCKQQPHKYQLYCPELNNMDPQEIKRIMTTSNIHCNMCLGTKHNTRNCIDTNEKRLKVCNKKSNNIECKGFHCGYLHIFFKKPTPVSNFTTVKETDTIIPEPPVEEANT